ncbi:PqiC family protein [Neokomagataea anthophila]|uniref:Membrane integrity-associated transporter subunit PqiC n=1 Tax=Neokomagataea anthophila TaxID=2826925 RepID=A0ABS5E8N2_9PROT|nr:PqiC family protein [Neokomagataea anthophila]MBR0560272.1 membrane integrity-associated transporter subunit PqiC [Neokomagataea anthophila]
MRHHMRKVLGRVGALSVVVLGATACSSPSPQLYTLAAQGGDTVQGGPTLVEVVTPVISSRLDRDTIVLGDRGYQTNIATGASWSEPLAEMLAHTLTTDLVTRLPQSRVYAQNDAVTASPTVVVEVTLRNFEADEQGHAYISGALTVHRRDGTGGVLLQPFEWRSSDNVDHNTARLVAELSHGVSAMADILAVQLHNTP